MDSARIRAARADDVAAVYEVCLRTADAGADASHLYDDPLLPGHVWAGAYLALEPSFAFVLEDGEGLAGYVLGARETTSFERRCEMEWWPALRRRYDDPVPTAPAESTSDQHAVRLIHRPVVTPASIATRYPSHVHIDLLPRVQGGGLGRRMMTTVLDALRSSGSAAVHLGVSRANLAAIGFYTHLGWHVVEDLGAEGLAAGGPGEDALVMGLRLDD